MNFKEQIQADIREVFINEDEFAENHKIDGQDLPCLIDEDKNTPNSNDGVYVIRRHLFISKIDLGYVPIPGQKMDIDDQYYYVIDCINENLLEVVLEARDS